MNDGSIDDARFSDEEVQEILRRAVAVRSTGAVPAGDGITLTDLRSIGKEVGIDAAALDGAARAVVHERRARPGRLLGAPRVVQAAADLDAVVPPEGYPRLVGLIRRSTGRQGEVTTMQGSLEWSEKTEAVDRFVTLSTEGDRTAIHASSNLTGLATMLFGPIAGTAALMSGLGFMVAANEGSAPAMVFLTVLVPVIFALLRIIFGRQVAAEQERIDQAVAELAEAIQSDA